MNAPFPNTVTDTIHWPPAALDGIVTQDDLKIAPYRDNGTTTGTPTWIWCVAVDGELYVRAYSGRASRWYQAALRQRAGRIVTAGAARDVHFEPVDGAINTRIDEAYRVKYRGSRYLSAMVSDGAREATVRILPAVAATEVAQ